MQGAGRSGVRILVGAKHFSPQRQDRLWGPRASYSACTGVLFPWYIQRLGLYIDHLPLSRFGVESEWSYTSIPLHVFTAWTGKILHFTFIFVAFFIYFFSYWLPSRALNPFRSYNGPRPTVWYSSSAPMSEDVRHGFCCICLPAVGACPTLFLM
jgi:hypothetical protein